MFENPRRGRQARNFTTNVPKILDFKSSSEQIFSKKLTLGAPAQVRIFENMILRMKPCCGWHGEFEYYLKLKTIKLKIYQENNDHGIYNISSLFEVGYRIVPVPR